MNHKDFFKDKRVAVIGLGDDMEMLPEIKFLLKSKAIVTLHEQRSESRLDRALTPLQVLGLNSIYLGELNKDSIAESDIIIRSPHISLDAVCFDEARKRHIPIETPHTLFLKFAPLITLVGVLGTCGKSTVVHLVHEMLKKTYKSEEQGIHHLDPSSGKEGALPLLKKVRKGDVIVARIPHYQIKAYMDARISPHVAVFTTLDPETGGKTHTERVKYAEDLFRILDTQTYNNFIVADDHIIDMVRTHVEGRLKSKMLRTTQNIIPQDWLLNVRGVHDKENIALALRVAELFKVPQDCAREVIERFEPLKGRLEFVKKIDTVDYYNDSASVVPSATLAALKTLSSGKNVTLIMGGAGKDTDITELLEHIPQYVSTLITLPGSGTLRFHPQFLALRDLRYHYAKNIEDAVHFAEMNTEKGGIVLFSPAFASDGASGSLKERGETFVKAVKSIKATKHL